MPFTIADMNRQAAAEEERKRRERQELLERKRIEAQQKAAQDRANSAAAPQQQQPKVQQPKTKTPAQPPATPTLGRPMLKEIPNLYYSATDPKGQAIRNYRAKGQAPVHTQQGSYSVLGKDPSQMNWAERMAYGRLTGQSEDYYNALSQESMSAAYKTYDPYFGNRSTLQWAIDAFDGQYQNFDDRFFEETAWLQQYENRLPDTLNISKAGMKNWTKPQLQAYARNVLEMHREETEKGATQWADLMTRAQDFYKTFEQGYGRKPTVDEFMASVDISKYPVLQKIDESRNVGAVGSSSPVILTRGIGYSHEKIYGLYNALTHGKALDPTEDYTEDAIQHHMKWSFQPAPGISRDEKRYSSDHANRAASMSPSEAAAAREEIRTIGNRQSDAEFTEALYASKHPEYSSYGIPPYTDDAYYAKMAPVYQPIIDAKLQMNLNNQGYFPKPDKDALPSEWAAYTFWQRWKQWEPDTKKVEAQWAKLRDDLQKTYGIFGAEVTSGEMKLEDTIDWKQYPELEKFLDGTGKISTTRPIYASQAAIQGVIDRIVKGKDVTSDDVDYAYTSANGQKTPQGPQEAAGAASGAGTQNHGGGGNSGFKPVQGAQDNPGIMAWLGGLFAGDAGNPENLKELEPKLVGEAPSMAINTDGLSAGQLAFLQDQRLLPEKPTSEETKATEAAGMASGEVKPQSAENLDTTKLSKDELITLLQKTNAALEASQDPLNANGKGMEMTAWMDEVQKLNDTYDILMDALRQMGMSDEAIEASIGAPTLYSDTGEPISPEQATASIATDAGVRGAQVGSSMASAIHQNKVEAIRQQIREVSANFPSDPVAMEKRNAELSGLYERLHELDAGPKLEALTPEQAAQPETKTWRMPRNLEDLRTGILDWSADVSKKPAWGLLEANKKLLYDPTVAVINKVVDEYHRIAGTYPTTAEEWKDIHAAEEKAKQGSTDNAMDMARDYWRQKLPVEAPEFTVEMLSYLSTLGSVAGERTAAGFTKVGQSTADLIVSLYLINNHDRFEKELGVGYTANQARAIDPVLEAALQSAEHWRHETAMLSPDVSKSLGEETNMALNWYDTAVDIYIMSSIGSAATSGINSIVGKIMGEALPHFAKLPASVQTVASIVGVPVKAVLKPVGWFAKNIHYELRAYSQYAKEAREMGKTEDEVHQYGLLGMFTNGLVEGFLGKRYEKVLDSGFKILMPRSVRNVSEFLAKNKKGVLDFLGTSLKNAIGEAGEESTEVLIQTAGKAGILHEATDPLEVADQMWQNAVGGFGGSLVAAVLLGVGGGAGKANQAHAEHVVKILSDPKASGYVAEAAAYMAKKGAKAAAKPATPPQTAPVPIDEGNPVPKPGEAVEAPTAPAEAEEPDFIGAASEEDTAAFEEAIKTPEGRKAYLGEDIEVSPQAQSLVAFVENVEAGVEEEGIQAEVQARVQQDVDNGLLDSFQSPTEPTFFAIQQAETAVASLDRELKSIDEQIMSGQTTLESMVRASMKNMIPVEAGNPKKISWNTTELIERLGRDKETVAKKIEDAKAQLQLLYQKWQAKQNETKAQREAEHDAAVRSEISENYLRRQVKNKAFRLSVTEGQRDYSEAKGDYLDALTRTPDEDDLGWVNESEEDPGWGQSRQKKEAETSEEMMFNDKDAEVRANGRGGAESLSDKLANKYAALGAGGPKDGNGVPMVEVPKKVYDDMLQKFKGILGSFYGPKPTSRIEIDQSRVKSNFASRTVQGAPSQYELALKERNLKTPQKPMKVKKMGYSGKDIVRWKKDRVGPAANMQQAPEKQQLFIERENLDTSNAKLPSKVDTMSPVKRAWKEGGYGVVAQNRGYYVLEDMNFTRKNLNLMAWEQDLEGIARDNSTDMSAEIASLRQNLSPRYYVINRSFESDPAATNESGFPVGEAAKYNPEELAVYATTDLDEAMGVIDGKQGDSRVPRQGGTVYYVSRDVLSQFNEKYARLTEQDKAAMSFEEYNAMVSGMIDQYAQEHGLNEQERARLYGAKNLFTKAGKEGWVVSDSNADYVLFINENAFSGDPLVNANVKSVEQALATLRAAINQQEIDRTGKKDNGEWRTTSYHDETTRNPKFRPDGRKSPQGTYYTREGTVIYSYNFTDPKTGKVSKLTAKLGAMDDTDKEYGRTFVSFDKVMADAFSIDVNTFFGNNRVNFTLERNYGQDMYGEFAQQVATDEGTILRDMTREIETFTRLIDDPDIALPMRQRFMRNLLDAQIKQTEKELYEVGQEVQNAGINPEVNQAKVNQYAYLKERQQTLAQMKAAITEGTKAEAQAVGSAAKSFYDSLKALDGVESQITYPGIEADLAALDSVTAALQGAETPDTVRMAYEQLYLVKTRMENSLSKARINMGGGALLGEYEWRIRSLDAKIKEVQADPGLSVEQKALRVKELSDRMQRYTDYWFDMTTNGVGYDTPSQIAIDDGMESTYNLEAMPHARLVQFRDSVYKKASAELRKVSGAAGSDMTNLRKYQKLLDDIDEVIGRGASREAIAKDIAASETAKAGMADAQARDQQRKQQIEASRVTADQVQNPKDARDTSGSLQAAVDLILDLYNIDPRDLSPIDAGRLLNRLSAEAQATSRAYQSVASNRDGGILKAKVQGNQVVDRESDWKGDRAGNMPQWLSDAFREAENLLGNIYDGNDPFAASPANEEPTEVQNGTPVGEGGVVAESVPDHPVVSAIISASEADEPTKEEAKGKARSVALDLTNPVTHSEVIETEMVPSRTTPRNPPAEETSVGNERPETPAGNAPVFTETVPLGPEGLPVYNGPADLPKPTDVYSARDTVAMFADELPVPVPEEQDSALLRRIRALHTGSKPDATQQEPAKPAKPQSLMKRVSDSQLQNRLEYYDKLPHTDFPVRPPVDMADVLGYRQRRSRLGSEISLMTKNIDKLADELKKPTLTDAQRDDLESKKAAIVVRRDSLKTISRLISKALKDEDAYQIEQFDEAITAARRYGKSIFIGARSNDPAYKPENEMDQIDKGLAEMPHHEKFGASKKTAVDALVRTRSLKTLAMNREIANAITAEIHRTQEKVDLIRQRVEALDALASFSDPHGSEAMWADANARRLEKQAALLESDVIRMQEAADLYYRDSSTDADTALFGNSRSGGSIPTSLGHTLMTMIKHGVGRQAGIVRASGRWVGEIINRAIETNPERIVENFLGKYAPIFNRVYIEPVAEGNFRMKTEAQDLYTRILKSGINQENEAIAHQYAEGRISFGQLMSLRPNDYKQIDEGIRAFRKIYDQLIDEVNETLTRNGFAPVPRRKDYFPHFRDGASGILSLLGLEENPDSLPLSMVGHTEEFRPLRQFVGNFLARTGNETDFGLITGAMRYIPSVLQVIHQTNNIVRLRQLEEMLSQTDENDLTPYQARRLGHFKQYMLNYTNHISGKKTGVDVLVGKSAVGREGLDFLRKVKQYRGLSLTFGSPTVMLSQLVSLGVSVAVAPTATAMAMAEMLHIVKDGDEAFNRHAFEARSQFLSRKYQGRPIPLTTWDNLMDKGQLPAEHLERMVSNVFVRAVYLQARREGMEDGPAMEWADKVAWRALSSRNKGETGIAYGNVVGGTMLQFGREAVNNIMFLVKDMPSLSPDRRKNVARMALLLLYNWLFNWMTGKETALDPIGAISETVTNPEEGDNAWQTGMKALGAVADTGWPVSFDFNNGARNLPVVAGARNIADAVANFSFSDPTAYERLVSAGLGFVPGGAQIERTYRGVKTYAKGYSESNLGDVRFPVTQNPADLILSVLVGDRSFGIGRWYRETNRKPLTNSQQEEFYKQRDAGIDTRSAFDAAIGTYDATAQTIDAKKLAKEGDLRGGYEAEKEAAKARASLNAPTGMPAWAYQDFASGDSRIRKAINAYKASNLPELLPKDIQDAVERSGKRVVITDENRAFLEDRQRKWFQVYMDQAGANPTPQEVKNAISKADGKAKDDFINKYWTEKR